MSPLCPVLILAVSLFVSSLACDLSSVPEDQKALAQRICKIEAEQRVMEHVLQELLQRVDLTVESDEVSAVPEKRKNEFIRFGKRSGDGEMEKRKNEFIRFGKRKNEFIRFGRSDPELVESGVFEKRKNEFIRFG